MSARREGGERRTYGVAFASHGHDGGLGLVDSAGDGDDLLERVSHEDHVVGGSGAHLEVTGLLSLDGGTLSRRRTELPERPSCRREQS
jgi:hypothetical protein